MSTRSAQRTAAPWLFLAPAIALFALIFVIPLGYTLVQSFLKVTSTNGTGLGPSENVVSFAGLSNYQAAFSDDGFMGSIVRITLLGAFQVPIMLGFALTLALLIDGRRTIGGRFFSLTYFLPHAVPAAVASVMWAFLVQPELSPFTSLGSLVGLDVDLTTRAMIMFTIANMMTWAATGYNVLIYLAAFKAIPSEVYEAARVDGAGPWRIAFSIKLPMIRPALVMTGMFSVIWTIQLYNEPAILKSSISTVDPNFSPLMSVYNAIQNGAYYQASARSVILAFVALVLSLGFMVYQRRRGTQP